MPYCTRHHRYDCHETVCKAAQPAASTDNAGDVSIGANTGDLNVGIGGGLTIDLANGDLGVQVAPGISIDF